VKQLTRELKHGGINVSEIHSDLLQAERENTLSAFTAGRIPVLVATDILSRGIDIDTIDVVINYDVPGDGEDYVHRIGRTARAEAEGAAFTLIGEKEQNKFAAIEQLLGKEVEKAEVPKEFGEVPSYHPRIRSGNGGNRGPKRKFYKDAPKKR
jgi:superfamily II DNA/RNA helicase